MITPTVGRIVHFRPYESDALPGGEGPLAAIITWVWSETCVNLCVFDANGNTYSKTSVQLVQPGGERPGHDFCEWMPYQVKKSSGSESGEKEAGTEEI